MPQRTQSSTLRGRGHLATQFGSYATLSREREHELIRRWLTAKDQKALTELVMAHGRLVASVARNFRNYGVSLDDLVQEGLIALMGAAGRFDQEKGVRFATYAVWSVRAAMQSYVFSNSLMVRHPASALQRNLFFSLRRLHAQSNTGGRPADAQYQELARRVGTRVDVVKEAEMRLGGRDISLNMPASPGSIAQVQDNLKDDGPNPEDSVGDSEEAAQWRRHLLESIGGLSQRERAIIEGRCLSDRRMTLSELARQFGVSKERARQIEVKALRRLKSSLEGAGKLMSPSHDVMSRMTLVAPHERKSG